MGRSRLGVLRRAVAIAGLVRGRAAHAGIGKSGRYSRAGGSFLVVLLPVVRVCRQCGDSEASIPVRQPAMLGGNATLASQSGSGVIAGIP